MVHGTITETQMFFVPHGITVGTPVPKARVEFVDGVGVLAVAIHEETSGGVRDTRRHCPRVERNGADWDADGLGRRGPSGRDLPSLRG